MVIQKTPDEMQVMARAGEILAAVHEELRVAVRPGVTTGEFDPLAYDLIKTYGAAPSFLDHNGYPATLCTVDGATAAHWEQTVAVTEVGPWVRSARRARRRGPQPTPASAVGA